MNQSEREYKNQNLAYCAQIAADNGLKVYTFESNHIFIEQIFITDGVNIGTVSSDFSDLGIGTVHKPCRECGTGFRIKTVFVPTIEDIKKSFSMYPNWAYDSQRSAVKKWASWEEYINNPINRILKYYEL